MGSPLQCSPLTEHKKGRLLILQTAFFSGSQAPAWEPLLLKLRFLYEAEFRGVCAQAELGHWKKIGQGITPVVNRMNNHDIPHAILRKVRLMPNCLLTLIQHLP